MSRFRSTSVSEGGGGMVISGRGAATPPGRYVGGWLHDTLSPVLACARITLTLYQSTPDVKAPRAAGRTLDGARVEW